MVSLLLSALCSCDRGIRLGKENRERWRERGRERKGEKARDVNQATLVPVQMHDVVDYSKGQIKLVSVPVRGIFCLKYGLRKLGIP